MPYFISHNHRLFYREQGSGPLLLILHGNTASSAHHAGELAYFGQRYRAVALDFLGCGQSDRLPIWPDDWWAQGGRDAAALVNHLGYEQALVMGASGGAIAALWMATQNPGQVQAVIADSCVEKETAEYTERLIQERLQFTPGQVQFWRSGHGEDWEQVIRADTAMWRRWAAAGADWFNGHLAEIHCPVLFSNSLRDEMAPDVCQQVCNMAMQVKGSQAFLATEGGHPLMWSRPDEFRRVADCFLAAIAQEGP
ncbi:MAG: alpha/beta hydrolase [Chloroflexi bacterium]|nr:alpha/beta hydrolase [Chloroflexota bacterium]MCL5273388.1 alpha/beta hydrolase [Chloroflexota bacterium]